jgi:hypothetical protein
VKTARPRLRGRYLLLVVLAAALALLLWPAGSSSVAAPSEPTAFRWDADGLFAALESEFGRAGRTGPEEAAAALEALVVEGDRLLATLEAERRAPRAALDSLATLQFRAAVRGAAHPALLPRTLDFVVRARVAAMRAAAAWPLDRATHEALYRVVFGGRIALDEALAQAGAGALPELLTLEDVTSATPAIVVEGVRIHSGDILLSRGGAPTSALIARGNDFPNTFSHAALAHVDAETGEGTVIEALIEAGSVLSTVSEYLEAKKHRILVLRLRPDHPALEGDPLLPHRAAESMLERVRAGHIPYDFAMAWQDEAAAFCSEIIYHAYREQGVELWSLRASMSAPGSCAGSPTWVCASSPRSSRRTWSTTRRCGPSSSGATRRRSWTSAWTTRSSTRSWRRPSAEAASGTHGTRSRPHGSSRPTRSANPRSARFPRSPPG